MDAKYKIRDIEEGIELSKNRNNSKSDRSNRSLQPSNKIGKS